MMVSEIMIGVAQTLFGWIGLSGVGSVYFMAVFFSTAVGIFVASRTGNTVGFGVGFFGCLGIFVFLEMFEVWIIAIAIILIAFVYKHSAQSGSWTP